MKSVVFGFIYLGYNWGLGEKSSSFTKLILEPTEAFTDFLHRLHWAVNGAISDPENSHSFKVLAFENVNTKYNQPLKTWGPL